MTTQHTPGRLYADRDIINQGPHYVAHVSAMTKEGLHSKSDIAAELAHRDIVIAELLAVLRGVQNRCAPYGFVGMDGQYLKEVGAAIAKAEGGAA